ncbi:MAG: saccharopine dehydrogenase family protein [Phycisphaerae bacterium]
MKKRVAVLGCGLVGQTLAADLARDEAFDVVAVDVSRENLAALAGVDRLTTRRADLSEPEAVRSVIEPCDLVVGALPSVLGFQTLKTVIACGKSCADISFMVEDPTELDDFAKEKGATVVYDCGVAPGLANMIIGDCDRRLDETTDVVYYVGGLPKRRAWPFEYKAPFAPSDVIEEYTRPARMVEDGRVVVKPALSEPERIDFPEVGELEAFNTDGLRSLLRTIRARNMKEKTLRYPGHCELMRVFRETGLFGKEAIEVGGARVRPLDVTSRLLFSKWRLAPDEPEFTILRVIVEGLESGKRLRYTYDLYDEYDAATGRHSMARTTAFPNAIMARMIASGTFSKKGVFPPECVAVEGGLFRQMIAELAGRGVHVRDRVEPISGSGVGQE